MSEALCTKENPYSGERDKAEKPIRWVHPDAKIEYEHYGSFSEGGSYEKLRCPHCGIGFRNTLPD